MPKEWSRPARGGSRYDIASGLAGEEPWGPTKEGGLVVIGQGLSVQALATAIEGLGEDQ